DVVPGLRGGDAASDPAPRHHGGARREPALEDLVPADQPPPLRGQIRIELLDEPALQFLLVLQAGRSHALPGARVALPWQLGNLVAADMDELAREQLEHLIEHILEHPDRRLLDVEDAVLAELRIGEDRRARVPRHLYLRDHGDAAVGRVANHLADVVLRVEASWALATRAGRLVRGLDRRVVAARADLRQTWVALDLDAPAGIVGQVQLQNVELVERHQVEHLEDELLGQEVPRDVDEQAAPGEARRIFDGDARYAPARVADGGAPEDLRRHQLDQRLDSVKRPGRSARADRDAAHGDIELITFRAEACEPAGEPQLDPVSGRTADDREVVVGRRRQRILQQARLAKQRLVRDDRGP